MSTFTTDIDEQTRAQAIDAFLADHPETERLELLLPDLNGIVRGKWIPRDSFAKLVKGAVRLPRSMYCLDIWGHDVESTGMAIEIGDPDGVCLPAFSTLAPVPWADRPTAQVLLSMREPGALERCHLDPRAIVANLVDRFAAHGLTPVVALEMEFYLTDKEDWPDDRPHPPKQCRPDVGGASSQIYDMEIMEHFAPVLNDMIATCHIQGIPADTAIAEFGPGQFEINLNHVPDALVAADQAVMMRRAIRAVARKHGLDATFMAKPYDESAGSGMHVHVSLCNDQGANQFATGDDTIAPLLHHAIGGLTSLMPATQLLFAPHANSYRRFQPGSYAPLTPSWGRDNRAVAVRVPETSGSGARFEHRLAGADANPYLVVAAVLSAVLVGIERELEPPKSSDTGEPGGPPLEAHWSDAIYNFERATEVAEILGARTHRVLTNVKLHECAVFGRSVTDVEYRTYLNRL